MTSETVTSYGKISRAVHVFWTVQVKQRGNIVYYYGGPQVQYSSYMHIAALSICFSSLLRTFFRLCQAFFVNTERFFLLSQAVFTYAATDYYVKL